MERLTKRQLRERLGFGIDAEIARFFEISSAAVAQWPEDEAIPELRQLVAERKRPDLFGVIAQPANPEPEAKVA